MEELMISWRDRGRGGNSLDGVGTSSTSVGDVSLPLGPGEWQEPLGLPLCVVCQNVRSEFPYIEFMLLIPFLVRPY
jgi:dynein light intermediate chain 1